MLTVLLAVIGCSDRAKAAEDDAFDAKLRNRITRGTALGERLTEREALGRFYKDRGGRPAWIEDRWLEGIGVREDLARDLLRALGDSERHGLDPAAYHTRAIDRALARRDRSDPEVLASLDVLLSDAFLHLARHLTAGAVDPASLHPGFTRAGEAPPDPVRVLDEALEAEEIAETLANGAPQHWAYEALASELARLRKAGAARAAAAHANAVRASLERWRWLPRELGRRHVRVNAASFSLEAFDGDEVKVAMRVVVGEKDWKTPLAHGAITYLELNPDWKIPRSIATREMLPDAQRDSDYFRAKGIQVRRGEEYSETAEEIDSTEVDWEDVDLERFPYHLRQPPGPHNPLGRIKFAFENPYGVYLHGTPSDHAFARGLRTLSHGCVRLEDEIALAKFALAPDPAWTEERLLEALRSASEEHRLPLPEPLPVYLVYFTAFAKPDGKISFSADAYEWDRALLAALE